MQITSLGHAGFLVEMAAVRLVIDPWFTPAFDGNWTPAPPNAHLARTLLGGPPITHVFVSHTHEDHCDELTLTALAARHPEAAAVCADFPTGTLPATLRRAGFRTVVTLRHQVTRRLMDAADGATLTVYRDTSHKEDAAVLVRDGGAQARTFLDLNDAHPPLETLADLGAEGIDVLAAQFSGASWYPQCYAAPLPALAHAVDRARADLWATFRATVEAVRPRVYLPSAGPPRLLDPPPGPLGTGSTFYPWPDVAPLFVNRFPAITALPLDPGQTYDATARRLLRDDDGISDLITAHFERRLNRAAVLLRDDRAYSLVIDAGARYLVTLDRRRRGAGWLHVRFLPTPEAPPAPSLSVWLPMPLLRRLLRDETDWETALLSLRGRLQRAPDVYDVDLWSFLRYGDHPAQIDAARRRSADDTIERNGYRIPRTCPHAGEDLSHATVIDGVLECPRHRWRWDLATGACLKGGNLPLDATATVPAM